MSVDRVPTHTQRWAKRRQCFREAGTVRSKRGTPETTASGWASPRARKAPTAATSCWPSASTCSAWLKPSAKALRRPSMTAAPLPRFSGKRCSFSRGLAAASRSSSARAAGPLPSSVA